MAFNAYKIGITVAVNNFASGVLSKIVRDFASANGQATALKGTLGKLGLVGGLATVTGATAYAGVKLLHGLIEPANEYIHQLGIMRRAGLDNVEMAQSISAAWANTGTVITTTATDNLKTLLDLRNVIAETNKEGGDVHGNPLNMDLALRELPMLSKIQAVLMASKEGKLSANADQLAFSLAKALDIRGAATDPVRFEREAAGMARVITAFQGRVTPQMFQQVFQYARQAKFDLSEEFVDTILPTLMLESSTVSGAGGGSRGVGPMLAALYRFTNQGFITKTALPELEKLGLLPAGYRTKAGKAYDPATMTMTQGTNVIGGMVGHELAASNPLKWVQEYLLPALKKTYGANLSDEQIRYHINQVAKGNQLAANLLVELATKQANFLRDQQIIQGAMNVDDAYKDAIRTDPVLMNKALSAGWTNLKTALGLVIAPEVVDIMGRLARALTALGQAAQAHPTVAKWIDGITITLTGLAGLSTVGLVLRGAWLGLDALGIAGGIKAIGAAFAGATGLASVPFLTIAAGLLALAGAAWGAYEIYSHWDKIKRGWGAEWANAGDANLKQWHQVEAKWPFLKKLFGAAGTGVASFAPGSNYNAPAFSSPTFAAGGGAFDQRNTTAGLFAKLDALADAFTSATVEMDGEKVGRLVFGHAGAAQNFPGISTSGHDGALSIPRF